MKTDKLVVIGIKHTLRKFKDAGLIEDDISYPKHAVSGLQDEILSVAQKWYEIGAKRGAQEVLQALLDADFEFHHSKGGAVEIKATKSILWSRSLKVTVGNTKQTIPKQQYELTLEQLGFE